MRRSTDGIIYSDDQAEDLNLPSPSKTESLSRSNALNNGTYRDTISRNINSKSHSPENIKACKALTGDCNCAKCYDSSGFYWGWKYQNIYLLLDLKMFIQGKSFKF